MDCYTKKYFKRFFEAMKFLTEFKYSLMNSFAGLKEPLSEVFGKKETAVDDLKNGLLYRV